MAIKKGHEFSSKFGFSGSAGKVHVSGYVRGGAVKRHDDAAQDRKLINQIVDKKLSALPARRGR